MSLFSYLRGRIQRASGAGVSVAVSTNYEVLADGLLTAAGNRLRDSWKNEQIPARQRELVDAQLSAYRRGEPVTVFDALVDILRANVADLNGVRLLEIGCSSGYYSEVFAARGVAVNYEGCDYSPAFIELARRHYPALRFEVQDAVRLSYPDANFDIVVSGGCILHIPDYEKAVGEAARVARRWVVFHRTPVLHASGPLTYTKTAYGVQTIETHFNEQKLIRLFARNGLYVADINTHSISWEQTLGDALTMKTYLCKKAGADAQ